VGYGKCYRLTHHNWGIDMTETTQTARPSASLQIAREWPAVFMMGLITLTLGVIVISWPQGTLTVLSVLVGLQILSYGVFRLITAFAHDTLFPGYAGFVGVVGIMAGVLVLRNPFKTVAVLAAIVGVVWIIGGIIEFIGSIADSSQEYRWLSAVGGLISIAAGVIVVAWPAPTVTVIAWISGLYMITFGLFICLQAVRLRSLTK
jgi:uncharacterized membrane protein HdeD (DUF308 family)